MRLLFKQRFFSWLDSYDIYDESGDVAYTVKDQLAWGHKLKIFDASGSEVDGDWFEWDYTIQDGSGARVATVSKELMNWTDTYVIDVVNPADALRVLMLVLAIDAEKCSRD